jgi:hypothetical protein
MTDRLPMICKGVVTDLMDMNLGLSCTKQHYGTKNESETLYYSGKVLQSFHRGVGRDECYHLWVSSHLFLPDKQAKVRHDRSNSILSVK